MARRAHAYPQVDPGAAALGTARTARLAASVTAQAALARARSADASVLVTATDAVVLREDLVRAAELGLGRLEAAALARPAPIVDARASEVAVRRHLAAGAPVVLVRDRAGIVGAAGPSAASGIPGPSMRHRLAQLPADVQTTLRTVAELAREARTRAWLVGGAVRDLLRGVIGAQVDLDIVVEGDALTVADRLADALGGRLVVHPRFLTASVDTGPGGVIDVVTARSERYEARGALPHVMPAGIRRDLHRRDFTVNAMAIDLMEEEATLLDPFAGRLDLAQRRLRILHPLAFVEDPTRIWRGARYAVRLGFSAEPWTRRCRRLALRLVPYPALSGARVLAELGLVLDEARPELTLRQLGEAGAFRLLDPRYRFVRRTRSRLAELPATLTWAATHGLGVRPLELALVILLADQSLAVAAGALERLGLQGEPRRRIEEALDTGHLRGALARANRPSARATVLRSGGALELAALHLDGDAETRTILEWWTAAAGQASALRGDDLIALGVPRGPEVARALNALRDARIDGTVTDRPAEIAYVQQWLQTRREA